MSTIDDKRNLEELGYIDLLDKLSKEINKRMPNLSEPYQRLLKYFLRENLVQTLGKTRFDREIDVLLTKFKGEDIDAIKKDGMLITTIFGSSYKINYRNDGLDAYQIPNDEKGNPRVEETKHLFSLTLGPDVITNTVVAPKGIVGPEFSDNVNFDLESTYEVNIPDTSFKYTCGVLGEEPSFKASLSGFNAKFSSSEMLSYYREIPPKEIEKNILKRFSKSRIDRGEGVVNITTSSHLTELTDYAEDIFNILKREASKVACKENSSYGKYLRAINGEY